MTSVLVVTVALPTADDPNTMAPLARQVASLRAAGLTVDLVEIGRNSKLNYLRAIRRVRKIARQYDVIHGHYGYCGWVARAQGSTPVVVSFMGDDLMGTPNEDGSIRPISGLVALINRWFAGRAAAVIVKSDEMAGKLRRPAHVIPNGVDVASFRPVPQEEARRELGWAEDELRVLFPGNPHNPRKQFGLASAAVREAERRLGVPVSLVVLHKVALDLVPQYMNACHAMILTSHIEGSPNVVKEAMACNLPVVSVAVGDTPQLLDGVENSFLCRRDEQDLADALVRVLTTLERSSGREVLLERGLDAESVAARIVGVYDDVRQRSTA